MFRRELRRVLLSAGIGVLMIPVLGSQMMPLYCVGLWYALPLLVYGLISLWAFCGQLWCFSLVMGRWLALLLIPLSALCALILTLSFGWLLGLVLAIRSLFCAYRHDSDLRWF